MSNSDTSEASKDLRQGDQQRVKSPKVQRRSTALLGDGQKPLRLRIVIVGSAATGKSCIIKRYCEKRFVAKYMPTIGIDYGATRIFVDKREVSVHIFDTSGQAMFTDVRNEFYRDAHGILVVFDVARRETFEEVADWMREAKAGVRNDTILVLCANKCDVEPDRE